MRAIAKQRDGGHHLNKAAATPPTTPQQAATRWGSFGHKDIVLQKLLIEQYCLCCYSEIRADKEGLGHHIEHIENKSQNPQRTFDYSNLAACALNSHDLRNLKLLGKDAFGGHAPDKQVPCDIHRFISPHRPDCYRFFAYLSDGRIVPAAGLNAVEKDHAQYTIDTLNLDCNYLKVLRRNWWAELDDHYNKHINNGWSLIDWAVIELVPVGNKLDHFFSLTRQFFGPIAEQALNEHAPELL